MNKTNRNARWLAATIAALTVVGRAVWSAPRDAYETAPDDLDLLRSDSLSLDLRGADLRGADLEDADLRHVDLTGIPLTGARYNDDTLWPAGYDPRKHDAVRVKEPGVIIAQQASGVGYAVEVDELYRPPATEGTWITAEKRSAGRGCERNAAGWE